MLATLVERLSTLPDTPDKVVEALVLAVDLVRRDRHLSWAFKPEDPPSQIETGWSSTGADEASFPIAPLPRATRSLSLCRLWMTVEPRGTAARAH